ncbi:MAG: hypothetical protein SGBAC_005865 [Bacillariaceae sp.]
MLHRTPSDRSDTSRSSTSTALKFTKTSSQIKLETMSGSEHSENDWKPLKPTRTTSSSDESSFFSEGIATTYISDDENSSIAMSDDDSFAFSENDCSVAISEITEPSMWSSYRESKPRDSLSLFYGEEAVDYILDAENQRQEIPRRSLHDSCGSNDLLPTVPVRRNISSDEDKFKNGSSSTLDCSRPPRPPRRQSTSGTQQQSQIKSMPTRRASTSDLLSSTRCNDPFGDDDNIEIANLCSLHKFASESMASIGSNNPPKFPRRSSGISKVSSSDPVPEPNTLMKRAKTFVGLCVPSTHSHRLKKYPNTFVGSEAVDLMLEHGLARTREDAVYLGHRFCKEYNLFHHVCFDHSFKDGHFFYRFTDGIKEDLSILPFTSLDELRSLGAKFSQSMEVSKHTSLMKTHKSTFMGNRAVDHMVASGYASTRMHGVFLGQRMLEELNLFQHVSDQYPFKDSPHLYRFVSEKDRSSFENTESLASVMSAIRSQRSMGRRSSASDRTTRSSLNSSERTTGTDAKSTGTTLTPAPASTGGNSNNKRSKQERVTFGTIRQRHYERVLECNPATTKGPSLGLGWHFYEDAPMSVDESYMIERSRYGFRVSSECRKYILMQEWGYSKSEIRKATKAVEKIRQNRTKSFNKVTVVRSFVSNKTALH